MKEFIIKFLLVFSCVFIILFVSNFGSNDILPSEEIKVTEEIPKIEVQDFYIGVFAGCIFNLLNSPDTTISDMPEIVSVCEKFTDYAIEMDLYGIHFGTKTPSEPLSEENST
ncbi:hypothetical protein LCGC14_2541570 [marine sediment metagenome]|uniref:Uncharacterized protein n=1 Tax=marine sediment metagenome TaxID=412755 RepID=A0A0F9AQK7_9ZZZZ